MTKPLTKQVAKKYGYGFEGFQVWVGNYIESLKIDERRKQIKPIRMRDENNLLTDEFMKYVNRVYPLQGRRFLILNPNYIYILKGPKLQSPIYIPVGNPFKRLNYGIYNHLIKGIHKSASGNLTYTKYGIDEGHQIAGVLEFHSQSKFMNWEENPLEVK